MRVRAEAKPLTAAIPGGRIGSTVVVEPILCGRFRAPRAYVERAAWLPRLRMLGLGTRRSSWIDLPVPAFLIRHPTAGPVLVDTGLHPSVAARPVENLGPLIARLSRPELEPGQDLPAQLRDRGVDARSIGLVVMTHMHFDHTSAMSEFEGATFVLSEREWHAATTDPRPLLRGYRPAHYDYAFDYRTLSYDSGAIDSYSSFGRTFDLFGDGSVRLASTPGHTAGHQSVICRLAERDLLIAGDAIYTLGQLSGAAEPPLTVDRHNWRRSLSELQIFQRQYPQAVIIPGHDAEHWKTIENRYE
ncbi:MAG TPA: N-acyl homoserine lactonase family protein [Solirubrobacterales bacterium]|nr:N-acyl homoserine lactonase family protein [Solirubrobacterales bacterium]